MDAAAPVRSRRAKKKLTIADFVQEMQSELAIEQAAAAQAEAMAKARPRLKEHGGAVLVRYQRSLQRDQLMPLVDLAYSQEKTVARSAIGLLATLSMNADNKDMLVDAGSLKPLLANVMAEDGPCRRYSLAGLAHMTAREDIRAKICAVPGGVSAIVEAVSSPDMAARQAAAECLANIASSMKLRGQLVVAKALPALASLIVARSPELKRWGMVALQRLAMGQPEGTGGVSKVTKEDPEGDGYAEEIMNEGVLRPLLVLLRGGPTVEEELRTYGQSRRRRRPTRLAAAAAPRASPPPPPHTRSPPPAAAPHGKVAGSIRAYARCARARPALPHRAPRHRIAPTRLGRVCPQRCARCSTSRTQTTPSSASWARSMRSCSASSSVCCSSMTIPAGRRSAKHATSSACSPVSPPTWSLSCMRGSCQPSQCSHGATRSPRSSSPRSRSSASCSSPSVASRCRMRAERASSAPSRALPSLERWCGPR